MRNKDTASRSVRDKDNLTVKQILGHLFKQNNLSVFITNFVLFSFLLVEFYQNTLPFS